MQDSRKLRSLAEPQVGLTQYCLPVLLAKYWVSPSNHLYVRLLRSVTCVAMEDDAVDIFLYGNIMPVWHVQRLRPMCSTRLRSRGGGRLSRSSPGAGPGGRGDRGRGRHAAAGGVEAPRRAAEGRHCFGDERGAAAALSAGGGALKPVYEWAKSFERHWDHQLDRIKQRAEKRAKERRG